jgi:hypothetical protein
MYDNWLDSIEEKIGERFRFAVEMTVKWGLRSLAVAGLAFSSALALVCFFCVFVESVTYILPTIIFLVLDALCLFLMFWTFGEEWF